MHSSITTGRARAGCRIALRIAIGALVPCIVALSRIEAAPAPRIGIENFSFAPDNLSVPVGTTVTWTNADDIPHSVVLPALSFHSKPLDTNDNVQVTFAKAGEFSYFCGLHPHMKGTITVGP